MERFAASLPAGSPVADIGCGPSQVARFLRARGLDALGLDLSPRMVALARRLNPDLRFEVGDMRRLEFPSDTFTGIVSFYSVIHLHHTEVERVQGAAPRSAPRWTLAGVVSHGRGETHLENWFGKTVSLSLTFFESSEVAAYLAEAGCSVLETSVRPPYAFEVRTERGYWLKSQLYCKPYSNGDQ